MDECVLEKRVSLSMGASAHESGLGFKKVRGRAQVWVRGCEQVRAIKASRADTARNATITCNARKAITASKAIKANRARHANQANQATQSQLGNTRSAIGEAARQEKQANHAMETP